MPATAISSAAPAAARSSSPSRRVSDAARPPSRRARQARRGASGPARCIRRSCASEPGSCPICGMALEPMTPTAGDTANPELARHDAAVLGRGRAVGAAARPLPWPSISASGAGCPDLAAPAVWVQLRPRHARRCSGAAGRSFERGWASIVNRRLNMFTLIALGTGVAYVYSLVAALAPGIFPASFRDARRRRCRSISRRRR